MPDSEFWTALRGHFDDRSKAKRAANREYAPKRLDACKLTYSVHNDGAHLIVYGALDTYDFWPGTGLWRGRKAGGKFRRGIENLILEVQR